MNTSVIVDLLIVAVLALNIFLGWSKGVVRGLLTLAGTILAFFIATQVADITSGLIVEHIIRPATHTVLEQHIVEWDTESLSAAPFEAISQAIDATENDFVREKAGELLSSVNLPTGEIVQETALRISGEVVDTVLRGVVQDILSVIICILCFAALSIALRPLIWIIEQAFELPFLHQINQLGGLISGAVRGVLLVLIAVWALRLTGIYLTDDVVSGSYLLKLTVLFLDRIGLGAAVL